MQYSINSSHMQKMIDFMHHKPESFIKQMLDQCIEQYDIFKQNQITKELCHQTSMEVTQASNKQNQTEYLCIIEAIEQSEETKVLQIPQIICKRIAQFAIGKIFACAHSVCDREIFTLPSDTKKYNKQRLFCSWTCKQKPMNCCQCHTYYNINTMTCVGDDCKEYICENKECLKDSKKCARMSCHYRYCSNCVKSERYWNCNRCSKVNVGCSKCDIWCCLCDEHHHQVGVNGKDFLCVDELSEHYFICEECATIVDFTDAKVTYIHK